MPAKDVIKLRGRSLLILEEIAVSDCIEFYLGEEGFVCLNFNENKRPPGLDALLRELIRMGPSALLEALVQGFAFHEGLKVVVPAAQLDAEALENTKLTLACEEYCQPFPTIFVDLPESFWTRHEVDCPQVGEVYYGEVLPNRHYPHTIGLRHQRTVDGVAYVIASIYFTSHQVVTTLLDLGAKSGSLEESIIASTQKAYSSISTSEEESAVTFAALRVALNTVLILEGEGLRSLGPANKKYWDRLEENVKKAKRRGDNLEKVRRAEQILREEPIYFAFDQRTVFYTHARSNEPNEPSDGVKWTMKPHWRSGHWRGQHYGAGNLLTKRVRIPSVFVNRHKFLGQPSNTTRTTEVRG